MFRRTLISLGLALAATVLSPAQAVLPPLDPATVTGTLDNGIRYYILKNPKPENRVEMRLVVQAGSLQEVAGEKGLAHLVEHMEFEGTDHFGSQEIVNFLESNGMRFGADLNANTQWATTQYFLKLPADNPGVLAKGLAILEDWAHGPKVDPSLLEKEKKIVAEENRLMAENSRGRLQLKALEGLNDGTAYADHHPIGDMAQVQAVTPAMVRHFVDTWYTPKAMSLVIVGSLDPAAMEKALRDSFKAPFANAGLPGPPTPAPRPEITADQTYFFQAPDLNFNLVEWAKVEHPGVLNLAAQDQWYLVKEVALGALNKRLETLGRQTESGLQGASVGASWLPWPEALFTYEAYPLEGQTTKAVTSFMTELKRAAVFGVTDNEFQLGVKGWLDEVENRKTHKDNITNDEQAGWLSDYVLTGQPVPAIDIQYAHLRAIAQDLTKEQVNAWLARYILPNPAKVLVATIDKPGAKIPTAEGLSDLKAKALGATVGAAAEHGVKALVPVPPAPGTITTVDAVPGTPFSRWTLSNGIQVYTYRNSFTKNGFQMEAFSRGGLTTLEDTDYIDGAFGTFLLGQNGLGSLNQTEIQDFLTGKSASLHWNLENTRATLSGSANPANPADMEKFFELLYARFTSNRRDPGAEASTLAKAKEWVANNENTPNQVYQNQINDLATNGAPRYVPFTQKRFPELNVDRAAGLQGQFFRNPGAFTFVFTGDYDEEALKGLVGTWVASLPASPSDLKPRDLGIRPVPGPVTRVVKAGQDNKAVVSVFFETTFPYSAQDWHRGSVLKEILDIRLREVLRQDKGGVYGVSVSADMDPEPYPYVQTFIQFTCAPENQDTLVKALDGELKQIAAGNISDEVFSKAVEIRKRDIESQEKTNGYWADSLYWALVHHDNLSLVPQWSRFYPTVKKSDLLPLAAQALDPAKALMVILNPEDKK